MNPTARRDLFHANSRFIPVSFRPFFWRCTRNKLSWLSARKRARKKCNTTEAIKVGKKAGGGIGGQNNGDQESKAKEDELAILNHERLLQLRESRGFDARVKKVSEVFCRRVQFCTTKYNIHVHVFFFTGN